MVVGEANEPVAPESCAVNTLPPAKLPLVVYGTLTAAPAAPTQNGELLTVPVVMLATTGAVPVRTRFWRRIPRPLVPWLVRRSTVAALTVVIEMVRGTYVVEDVGAVAV